MSRVSIDSFLWDDVNEAKVARHGLTADDVDDVLVAGPFAEFPNRKGLVEGSRQLVGKDFQGRFITVIIEPIKGVQGLWRPRTAWPSKKGEITKASNQGVS